MSIEHIFLETPGSMPTIRVINLPVLFGAFEWPAGTPIVDWVINALGSSRVANPSISEKQTPKQIAKGNHL